MIENLGNVNVDASENVNVRNHYKNEIEDGLDECLNELEELASESDDATLIEMVNSLLKQRIRIEKRIGI